MLCNSFLVVLPFAFFYCLSDSHFVLFSLPLQSIFSFFPYFRLLSCRLPILPLSFCLAFSSLSSGECFCFDAWTQLFFFFLHVSECVMHATFSFSQIRFMNIVGNNPSPIHIFSFNTSCFRVWVIPVCLEGIGCSPRAFF